MNRLLTDDEISEILSKASALRKAGKEEEGLALAKQVPMPAYLAKFWKDHIGAEELLKLGWNMAEAEAVYGQDWLTR